MGENIGSGFVEIRDARAGDSEHLKPILEQWVRNPEDGEPIEEEIDGVVASVEQSISKESDRAYKVAVVGGKIVGMVGMKIPESPMSDHASTSNPAELVNMYVDAESRGMNVGRTLVEELITAAKAGGKTEVLVNSGPRYQETAWGFYDRLFGERIATLLDYYGEGIDAPVWRMDLSEQPE